MLPSEPLMITFKNYLLPLFFSMEESHHSSQSQIVCGPNLSPDTLLTTMKEQVLIRLKDV